MNLWIWVVYPTEKWLNWLNTNAPDEGGEPWTVENLDEESLAFIMEAPEGEASWEAHLKEHQAEAFETFCAGFVEDETLWPKELVMAEFAEWFEDEILENVVDLTDDEDEEEEDEEEESREYEAEAPL